MAKVLLVDDEASILSVLSVLLKAEGYEVLPVDNGEKAIELIKSTPFDLMISDIRMRPVDGIALLKAARETRPTMSVLMITGYGTIETAVESLKYGAFDYITKPFKVDELLITVQRAIEYNKTINENIDLKAQLTGKYRFENIIAESRSMRNVCEMIDRVAPTDATVLIYGESGTGKELVAQAIHAYSSRKNKKFLPLNCAALPEPLLESELFGHVKGAFTGASADKTGLFEVANTGTIFLDEIDSMPLSIQAKLLRVVQEKEIMPVGSGQRKKIDVRILSATNRDLKQLVAAGKFREDLYFRLNVVNIHLPALRERPEDIPPLVEAFVTKYNRKMGRSVLKIEAAAIEALVRHDYRGNVRELENIIEKALVFLSGDVLTLQDLPPEVRSPAGAAQQAESSDGAVISLAVGQDMATIQRQAILATLQHCGGDKQKAAELLKISERKLWYKLKEYGES